ncbi:MAG TPA: ROK family transcriptional regulator [Candidatus Eremiobacteraceae bacterium]|nr:ROK family transcriptional regulator [Candidatus Eremiobacteraceae bacterium]
MVNTTRLEGAQARNPESKSFKNEWNVLQLIHAKRNISRIELSRQTGLSAASITAIVQNLIGKGLVVESGHKSTALGRKPVSLSLREDAGFLVGVDLGSFYTRVVVTDIRGALVNKQEFETGMPDGRDSVLSRTLKAIHKAIDDSGTPRNAFKGIGIGHSGVIDVSKGLVLSFPRPGQMAEWKNVPLRDILEREFGVPCLLEDSVRAIATAEKHFGLGAGLNDFIYVDVGMGIGAAIFLDGKLYRGSGGSAGEFGHMTVDEHGPLCCCGNNGCLETLASCGAIIQSVKSAIEKGVDSKVRELAQGDLNRISIEMIGQAAMESDSLSFRALHEAVSHIAVALADVVNLLNPHVLIFGGALFRSAPDLFLEPLKRTIKQRALEKSANEVQLKISTLGSEAGALGAGRLISEIVIERLYLAELRMSSG